MKRVLYFIPSDIKLRNLRKQKEPKIREVLKDKLSAVGGVFFFYELKDGPPLLAGTIITFKFEREKEVIDDFDFEVIQQERQEQRYFPESDTLEIPVRLVVADGDPWKFLGWLKNNWVAKMPLE